MFSNVLRPVYRTFTKLVTARSLSKWKVVRQFRTSLWITHQSDEPKTVGIPDLSQEFKGMDPSFPCLLELAPRYMLKKD